MIRAEQVVKAYRSKLAADGISLEVQPGRVLGLLGPNGAGKTTLIRMLTRITLPDSGQIWVNNEPLAERHQALMGYLPEERGLYRKMKVQEQLRYLLQLKGMSRAEADRNITHWLERFQLADRAQSKVQELSKGMQQKIQFIATVAHQPDILILDEPFSGLDPINSQLLQEVMMELKAAGRTLLFSSHRMEQVEEICDDIALINNGKIILNDSLENVQRQYRRDAYLFHTDEPLPTEAPAGLPGTWQLLQPSVVRIVPAQGATRSSLIAWMNEHYHLTLYRQEVPSLREIFIDLVGHA